MIMTLKPFTFGVGDDVLISGMSARIVAAAHSRAGEPIYLVEYDDGFIDHHFDDEIVRNRSPKDMIGNVVDLQPLLSGRDLRVLADYSITASAEVKSAFAAMISHDSESFKIVADHLKGDATRGYFEAVASTANLIMDDIAPPRRTGFLARLRLAWEALRA
jgi:hypothetical protein